MPPPAGTPSAPASPGTQSPLPCADTCLRLGHGRIVLSCVPTASRTAQTSQVVLLSMWPKTLLAPSLQTRPGARCTALTLGQRPVTSLSRVPACVPFLPPMSEGPLSLLEPLPHCQRHLQSRQRHTLCLHGSLPASSCCCLRWCLRASQTCHLPAPEAGGPRGSLGAEIGASPGQHPRPCPLASRRHPSFRSGTVLHPQSQHVPPRGPRPLPPAAPQGPCAPGHPVPRRRPVSRPCLHHTCRVAFAMRWAGHRLRGGCGPGLTSAPTRTDAPASPLSGARPRRGPGRPRAHWVPHKLEMSLQQDLSSGQQSRRF